MNFFSRVPIKVGATLVKTVNGEEGVVGEGKIEDCKETKQGFQISWRPNKIHTVKKGE